MNFFKKIVVTILTIEARLVLRRYKPRIIAVTGSVGKTTTKDAIFAALSPSVHMRKSKKSFNSDVGVPLAILGLENGWGDPLKWFLNIIHGALLALYKHDYPQWLVLEVGADRPGDISSIARWLCPDIAVITAVPEIPVHVEFFDSPEAVLREKRSLADHLKPGGLLIVNGDDPRLSGLPREFPGRAITYGMEGGNDISGAHDAVLYDGNDPVGVRFVATSAGESATVALYGALGHPRIYAALAAFAAARAVGVAFPIAADALAQWTPPPGRMRLIAGLRGTTVIDDTYNSSPAAALAALDTLASVATAGRRIAVMGDMLELGKYSVDAHRQVGERAAVCADMLITVGFRARAMAEAALDAGMGDTLVRSYEQGESDRAGLELEKELRAGDIILVKGSQSMRLERTVKIIMNDSQQAGELLVRQEGEWSER